ncbi:hypothetical protein HDU84_002229 [Entophlyctis sp. JEL0112]|nr:hypothetical protein HDU84_002229 [Entophlyctis sp. JEL0112]
MNLSELPSEIRRDYSRTNGVITKRSNGPEGSYVLRKNLEPSGAQVCDVREMLEMVTQSVFPCAGFVALRDVDFRGLGDLFGDKQLLALSTWCILVESCNVSGTALTNSGIETAFLNHSVEAETGRRTAAESFKSLRQLLISGTQQGLTDAVPLAISANISAKNLLTLDLEARAAASQISDTGIAAIASECVVLETLNVSGSSRITDASLIALAGWEPLPTPIASRKTVSAVKATRLRVPALRILRVAGCFAITDLGVVALLAGCARLEALDVGYCWRVSDAAFCATTREHAVAIGAANRAIAAFARERAWACADVLRGLGVRFCYLVTDAGVQAALASAPHVDAVDVTGCLRVTSRAAPLVREHQDSL